MRKKEKENLLIIDGFAIERASMIALLSQEKSVGIVHEASSLEEAKKEIENNTFSLIIFSMVTLDEDERSLFSNVIDISKGRPVMALGPSHDQSFIQSAIQMGARAYVTKKESKEVLLEAAQKLLDGGTYFSGMAETAETKSHYKAAKGSKDAISEREKEILRLVTTGLNNISIGQKLNISVRTVENHRANIMRKLKVKNTAELVKIALTESLIE